MFSNPILGVQSLPVSLLCHPVNCIHLLSHAEIRPDSATGVDGTWQLWKPAAHWTLGTECKDTRHGGPDKHIIHIACAL